MKLETYMKKHDLSDDDMAALIKKDRTMIGRYRRGEVLPPSEVIREIQIATDLAVQFNDWFSPDQKQDSAA